MKWNKVEIRKQVLVFIGVAEEYFDKELASKVPEIKINGRLKSSLGRCCYYNIGCEIEPTRLEFAKFMFEKYSDDVIKSVIGHEVAHLITGLIYGGGHGHDKTFKQVCSILSSKTGIKISNGTVEKNISLREEYIAKRKDKEKYIADRKKELGRYMVKCGDCDMTSFYKRAKKGSIESWILDYRCSNDNHKTGLICYDLKDKVKYTGDVIQVIKSKMTVEEMAECDRIILENY